MFCLTAAAHSQTQPVEAVRQEVKAIYMQADAATKSRDISRLLSHYSDDYKLVLHSGKILRFAQVADYLHWQLVATKEVKELSFEIMRFSASGDNATAEVKQKETLVVVIDGAKHTLVSEQISTDVWKKTPKGWRLKLQTINQNLMSRDGKPVAQG